MSNALVEPSNNPEQHEVQAPLQEVLLIDPSSPDWETATDIEARVFIDAGYVENKAELTEEYAPYLPASSFAIVKDGDIIKGVMRVIRFQGGIGFKTFEDARTGKLKIEPEVLDELIADQKNLFEVGTIGVPEEYRTKDGMRASLWLYGAVFGISTKENLPRAIASFDEGYLNGFKGIFGDSIVDIGEAVEYMGSKTVPVIMDGDAAYTALGIYDPEGTIVKNTIDEGMQQIVNA